MSLIQKLFTALLPRRWAESMEADSRAWMMRCPCGLARSIWELGGIRWKASRSLTYSWMKCPGCGRRSWHKLVPDEPPPAPRRPDRARRRLARWKGNRQG